MSKTAEPRNSSWGPPSKWSFQSPLSAKEMYLIDHGFSWLIVSFLLSAPFLLVCVSFFVFARFYLSLEPTFHRQPFIRNNGESCPLLTWFQVLMNCVCVGGSFTFLFISSMMPKVCGHTYCAYCCFWFRYELLKCICKQWHLPGHCRA